MIESSFPDRDSKIQVVGFDSFLAQIWSASPTKYHAVGTVDSNLLFCPGSPDCRTLHNEIQSIILPAQRHAEKLGLAEFVRTCMKQVECCIFCSTVIPKQQPAFTWIQYTAVQLQLYQQINTEPLPEQLRQDFQGWQNVCVCVCTPNN